MHKQPEVTAATRQKIMDSFWGLYTVTPIEKITISAISKNAGIHRSTFYEYFKDIYDLLEQFENDLLKHLEKEFIPVTKKNMARLRDAGAPSDLSAFINTTLSFFINYGNLLYHLSGPSGDAGFRKKLFTFFKAAFLDIHDIPADSHYADYLASLVFTIILNNMEYCYEHPEDITIQEVISLTYQLLGEGLSKSIDSKCF